MADPRGPSHYRAVTNAFLLLTVSDRSPGKQLLPSHLENTAALSYHKLLGSNFVADSVCQLKLSQQFV